LGLISGFGLKGIIQGCYDFIVDNFEAGDEIYIFGFSRGAYAARALAAVIGTSGIQRRARPDSFEIAWSHYRVKPTARKGEQSPGSTPSRIKFVGVWDTVGAYGIPAGFGLAPLARYIPLLLLGFHDTSFGEHIDVGLHAVAVDERRREFVPTFWTAPKGKHLTGHVEQTWFSGMHDNVGGGRPDTGLSDIALIWMIARVQALTGLKFDVDAVRNSVSPNVDGEVYDSTAGLPFSRRWPHIRTILSSVAIHHGYCRDRNQPEEMHINERVHWSVLQKRGRPCTVFGVPNTAYNPPNLPTTIPADGIAAITPEEHALIT
jgi:T6SS, Phospholipase effector Tle1-like, catalytic domain